LTLKAFNEVSQFFFSCPFCLSLGHGWTLNEITGSKKRRREFLRAIDLDEGAADVIKTRRLINRQDIGLAARESDRTNRNEGTGGDQSWDVQDLRDTSEISEATQETEAVYKIGLG
jgi:hypothetical protein